MRPRSTIRDVAAHAGVSSMTASRTLRDDPGVSGDKRQRVLDAVQSLGYRRNEAARNLRLGGTSGLVGLVVTKLANPIYAQFALGVEAVAGSAGLQVVLANTDENVNRERQVVTELIARGVDGVIVVPAGSDHGHLHPDRIDGVPIVLSARPPTDLQVDCVLVDDFGGARTATARLIAQGHERIGFLGLPPSVWTSSERFRGFCVALEEAGITLDESYVRLRQRTIEAAEGATRDLLRLPDPPTAFFCANSQNTLGAFRALRACGTPAGLAGFDDFEDADVLGRNLIIVAYDPGELGRQAARLLLERMDRHDGQPAVAARRVVVGTTVVEYRADRLDTASPRRATVG